CGRDLRHRHQRARRRRLARGLPASQGVLGGDMDLQTGLLLFGAGVAGGVVTAMVGGASLITFPALLAGGLPAVVANASNTVALTPGNLVAALADVERLPRWDRSLLAVSGVCAAGSVAGAALLLMTPEKAFTAVVPLLIGFATLLFALSGRIRAWIVSRAPTSGGGGSGVLLLAPVAGFGGLFRPRMGVRRRAH